MGSGTGTFFPVAFVDLFKYLWYCEFLLSDIFWCALPLCPSFWCSFVVLTKNPTRFKLDCVSFSTNFDLLRLVDGQMIILIGGICSSGLAEKNGDRLQKNSTGSRGMRAARVFYFHLWHLATITGPTK